MRTIETPYEPFRELAKLASMARLFALSAPRMKVMASTGSTIIMVTISRLAPTMAYVFLLESAPSSTDTPPRVRR